MIAVALVAAINAARAGKFDTEHLFGFTTGTDVNDVGEREIESEVTDRLGKQAGSYNALSQTYEAKITPVENFRIGVATTLAYYGIRACPVFPMANNRHCRDFHSKRDTGSSITNADRSR
jgi:hypothetical protein